MTKTEVAALEELGMTPEQLQARAEKASAMARGDAKQKTWYCPRCEATDDLWSKKIVPGANVELASLDNNQRCGFGTGGNDHALYTHNCKAQGLKPTRKPRSDKGVPKPKKQAEAAQGVLSAVQVARLRDLIETVDTKRLECEAANAEADRKQNALFTALTERDAFMDSLKA